MDALKFVFSLEWLIGVTRTGITYVYAWLLAWAMAEWPDLPFWSWVPDLPPEVFVLAVGTALYGLVRSLAERWPWIGNFLIFNKKPEYAGIDADLPLAAQDLSSRG